MPTDITILKNLAAQSGWSEDSVPTKGTAMNTELQPSAHEVKPVFDLNDEGNIKKTRYNYLQAIINDPNLHKHFKDNIFSHAAMALHPLPWETDLFQGWKELTNDDIDGLATYIERVYGLGVKDKVISAFRVAVHNNTFNPVKEMLEMAHSNWDGKFNHIEELLPSMLGAEHNAYNETSMRIFMLGAIHRIFEPGCKFDLTLVLVGDQGIGKSHFLMLLAVIDDWFSDSVSAFDDKAIEKIRGRWIIELAEMNAVKNAQSMEAVKSFLTRQADDYRMPYAQLTERWKRMCVFAGTVNPTTFLSDPTGNRRFLPIKCGIHEPTIDMFENEDMARAEILQAWGEAMALYANCNGKPKLVLPPGLKGEAKLMQEFYEEEDTDAGIIQDWLDSFKGDAVCGLQIWHEALKNFKKPSKADSNRIADLMRHHITGWQRTGNRLPFTGYGQQRAYERTKRIIDADETPTGQNG